MDITNPRGVFTFETQRREPGALEVVSFTGHEAVSKLYSFDVTVSEPIEQADTFEQDVLGGPARLLARGVEEVRAVRGIVRAVALSGSHRRTDRIYYRVRVAPRLWLLTRTRHSRIFQDKTAQEIVTAVLDAHRVRHRWSLRHRLPTRVYCVQHQESDLHFIRRILAEEGVFFFFEHGPFEREDEPPEGEETWRQVRRLPCSFRLSGKETPTGPHVREGLLVLSRGEGA